MQLSVSWQQSFTMHWLHGVPPGSSGHVPASTGTPQWPLSQVSPAQHCVASVQLDPVDKQPCAPQTEPSQTPEQHSAALVQAKPSSSHPFTPQTSSSQAALQQSVASAQGAPSGEHVEEPQTPSGLQVASQQSLSCWHP
jgi:hypothetical protein